MGYKNCLTQEELNEFSSKSDIEVVFDIGVKDNIEYLELKPLLTFHLFEPMPESILRLKENLSKGKYEHVYVNDFGIGDFNGNLSFNTTSESFEGSLASIPNQGPFTLPIRSLDSYIDEHKIKKIDFIKMDTEGYEYKIIKGNPHAISLTKYLQYEHWGNDEQIRELLPYFTFKDIGSRNIFCTRKTI